MQGNVKTAHFVLFYSQYAKSYLAKWADWLIWTMQIQPAEPDGWPCCGLAQEIHVGEVLIWVLSKSNNMSNQIVVNYENHEHNKANNEKNTIKTNID